MGRPSIESKNFCEDSLSRLRHALNSCLQQTAIFQDICIQTVIENFIKRSIHTICVPDQKIGILRDQAGGPDRNKSSILEKILESKTLYIQYTGSVENNREMIEITLDSTILQVRFVPCKVSTNSNIQDLSQVKMVDSYVVSMIEIRPKQDPVISKKRKSIKKRVKKTTT